MHVENAHSDEITGLKFSSDGRILLSRSFDGSLKVVMQQMFHFSLVSSYSFWIFLTLPEKCVIFQNAF